MAPVDIHEASANDVAELVALFAQLGYGASPEEVSSRVEELGADPQSRFFVAILDGRLVGAVTLYFVPVAHQAGSWCRLTALIVDEQVRGRGVGQALVAASEEAARAASCARVEATSATARADAHAFYERLGYRPEAIHFLKLLDDH